MREPNHKRRRDRIVSYLLEFRLSGSARQYIRQLVWDVAREFNVRGVTEKRVVPHVTLVGPFTTTDENRLIHALENVGINFDTITYSLHGFMSLHNGLIIHRKRVLAVNIEQSPELSKLRLCLVQSLAEFCKLSKFDEKEFKPHVTIAFKDIDKKFGQIEKFLSSRSVRQIENYVLRITLLKGARILREYDLMQRRMLTRYEALNRDIRKATLQFMRHRLDGSDAGYSPKKPLKLSPTSRVFLISDTHFDHANIIRFCNRPFRTKEEMNEKLVRNWNAEVGKSDVVFFLGDLTFGPNHHTIDYWLDKLNGQVFFIRGSHDTNSITKAVEIPNFFVFQFKGRSFLLSHKPNRPEYWNDWMIHGDKHNNDLIGYPLVSRAKKTVNVSAEVVNYRPILIDYLISEIDNGTRDVLSCSPDLS